VAQENFGKYVPVYFGESEIKEVNVPSTIKYTLRPFLKEYLFRSLEKNLTKILMLEIDKLEQ